MNSFKSLDAVSKVGSNLEMFRNMGKIYSKVVLFFIIRTSRDSIKLGKRFK